MNTQVKIRDLPLGVSFMLNDSYTKGDLFYIKGWVSTKYSIVTKVVTFDPHATQVHGTNIMKSDALVTCIASPITVPGPNIFVEKLGSVSFRWL